MIRKFNSKKDLILDATLQLMAEKNSTKISIREIAARADMNVASINYYFNSKKELLEEVDKHFLSNFLDIFDVLGKDELSKEEILESWLKKAISYGFHYPGILIYIQDKLQNAESDTDMTFRYELLLMISEVKDLLIEIINPYENDEAGLFMALGGCFFFPLLAKKYLENMDINLSEEQLYEQIISVIDKFRNKI